MVAEARKYSALAIDTLVELTKDSHTDSTRFNAATALLDRGYGRPAQSLDLHLSADAITKRLSDMTDAELAALEQRMIATAPIVLEATADVSDDAVEPTVTFGASPPASARPPAVAQPVSLPPAAARQRAPLPFRTVRGACAFHFECADFAQFVD